jgi:hypothetical protein
MLGMAVFTGFASFQQYERSVRIQEEINILKSEADRVARENETLSEKIQYFASPDFKEEEAKEKLGLRRQEEKVIAIEGDRPLGSETTSDEVSEESEKVAWDAPNYRKWWDLFFTHAGAKK